MLHRHKLNSHSMQVPLWFSQSVVVGCWPLFRLLPIMSAAQFLFFTCSFLNCDACLFLTDLLVFSCVRDHNASLLCITNGLTWSVLFLFLFILSFMRKKFLTLTNVSTFSFSFSIKLPFLTLR